MNLAHDVLGLGFASTALTTMAACGGVFFVGLRAGRAAMPWMPSGDAKNMVQDAGLSVSIGGATGCFVATDTSFVGAQADALYKVLAPVYNVLPTDSALVGCIKAGSSTLSGFGAVNAVQALLLPAGTCWMDNNNPYAAK